MTTGCHFAVYAQDKGDRNRWFWCCDFPDFASAFDHADAASVIWDRVKITDSHGHRYASWYKGETFSRRSAYVN